MQPPISDQLTLSLPPHLAQDSAKLPAGEQAQLEAALLVALAAMVAGKLGPQAAAKPHSSPRQAGTRCPTIGTPRCLGLRVICKVLMTVKHSITYFSKSTPHFNPKMS